MMWWHVLLLGLYFVHSSEQSQYSLNSTFNLVKHLKSISASNTCGEEGEELYCLLTGTPLAPGLDYTYSRYPGRYIDGQYCNTCETGQHRIENTIDEDEDNWWQSSSLATITDNDQEMTIDLNLGQEFQVVYFVLKAANSPRPARWVLEKSTDKGKTFVPWQIYVPTDSDCELYYNSTASHFPVNFLSDDQVLCTSYYSTLNPLENGQIYTSLVVGRPGAEFFYLNESPRLQQWMKATHIRLRLEQMQILHNLVNADDDTANRRFFYSIREIIVAGRCSCNGHAHYCTQMTDNSVQCECKGNTCGANCDTCCPGYNVFPWQPSSSGQHFQCEECQCYGHSEECVYDASIEGQSVDIEGEVRGGARCTDCADNTEGLNCERCIEGHFRGDRESLEDKTCRECECNTANIELVEGMEFGSCDQGAGGQCYCKEQFGGRTCDECRADHFNSVDIGLSCGSCDCEIKGTVSQLQDCEDLSGQCFCKDNAIGAKCDECRDQTFNITIDNDYGCSDCACNTGGSEHNKCDKVSGQCLCKSGLDGRQCDEVAYKHFVPGPDYLSLEAEDGEMRGRDALYDFRDNVFKDGFSGKGYATLNSYVPRVDMEVDIPKFTRYQVKISYQLEDKFQANNNGYIVVTNPETGEEVRYDATLEQCQDGCEVTMKRCRGVVCEDIYLSLTPGKWLISFHFNGPTFNLDRLVLTPRDFEEPYIEHTDITSCTQEEQGLCNEYHLPNLEPYIHKTDLLKNGTTTFVVDDGAPHSIILDFLYNSSTIDDYTLTIDDGVLKKTGYVTLHDCEEMQMCRAIVRDEYGQPLVYNSEPRDLTVTFDQDLDKEIRGKMYLVVFTEDLIYALKPQYICKTHTNGICTVDEFPLGIPRFTRPGVKGYLVDEDRNKTSDITEDYIEDRTNYPQLAQICGSTEAYYEARLNLVNFPNDYRIILEYFYTGLQDLSVTVEIHDDSKQVGYGIVTFAPCNGFSACRTLVMNVDEDSEFFQTPLFRFESKFVLATLKDIPMAKCILLNEMISTVSTVSSYNLVTPIPLIRTSHFKASCTPESSSEFCRQGYLTIAADFYNGLPECGCNEQGSLHEECEAYGGQCPCKENVIGRPCDRCAPGFFNFPECQPCPMAHCEVSGSGFSSICSEETGECECAPNIIGERCDQCDSDSYDYDGVLGCRDCDCHMAGSAGASCNDEGICYCKNDTITGDKCDECVEGRTDFPSCNPCLCDIAGSTGDVCDTVSGQCPCKPSTAGLLCDTCEYGSYNLRRENDEGCQECFCFGVTDNCTSASMNYYKIGREFEEGDNQGWRILSHDAESPSEQNSMVPTVQQSSTYPGLYELSVLSSSVAIELRTGEFDWLSPYKGDLMYSFGGKLKFNIGYFPNRGGAASRGPRVEIRGVASSGVFWDVEELPGVDSYLAYTLPLEAGGMWYSLDRPDDKATIDEIMTILIDVKSLRIRGDLSADLATYKLMSVSLESAFPTSSGTSMVTGVTHVEHCSCPLGYNGTSCEACTSGYYRLASSQTSLLGECVPCDCNGNSGSCDLSTGICTDCQDNTEGDHCERCKDGYYGDPGNQGDQCEVCPCPLPAPGNSFGTCEYNPGQRGGSLTCECEEGYEGDNCGTCSSGYYGSPTVIGGSCQECSSCNNNTDVTADYCDATSGDCTLCMFDTAGDQCEICADGYHGDAIGAKDCAVCECDGWGTQGDTVCDSSNGECSCQANVIGHNCNECEPGHWNHTINGVFEHTQCKKRDCSVDMTKGNAEEYTKYIEITYQRSRGSNQRVTFFDKNGDLTEYIEIFDIDLSPSYRIGHDIRDCYFGKELDLSVFEADTTVTLQITISEKHIIIYINGKEETGERYDRETSNINECYWNPTDPIDMSFSSNKEIQGDVEYMITSLDIGCTSCGCNQNGTVDGGCGTDTGQCVCHDSVQGYKCDMCKDDFYGLNTLGHCTECDCNMWGSNSTDCDKDSGQCSCLEGLIGQQCDICEEWSILTSSGCEECTGCSRILKDYMDDLSAEIGSTIRTKEAGGRITQDKDQLIDMKNTAIVLKSRALQSAEAIERYQSAWGAEYPVKSGSVKYQYNKLFDSHNLLQDKLEEKEDLVRSKQEGIDLVMSQTEERNTTYAGIQSSVQASKDMIDNIKITAAEPDVIEKAIRQSKNKIKEMKERKIKTVHQRFVDRMTTLNSTVYANYGALVGTDLGNINTRISSLSDNMKSVLAFAVASVAAPIDEFTTTSDSITGDLSNLEKNFENRRNALTTNIDSLETSIQGLSVFELHNQVMAIETFIRENFDSDARNLTDELSNDVQGRRDFVDQYQDLDMSDHIADIEEMCRPLKNFIETPENTPVKVVKDLQSFNNETQYLSDLASHIDNVARDITRNLNQWGETDLSLKRDKVSTVTHIVQSHESTIPTLEAKITTGDLENVIAQSQSDNEELRRRLDEVETQIQHQPRSKRYVSVHSVEGFTSTGEELQEELEKQNKTNNEHKQIKERITASEDKLSALQGLSEQNNQNIQQISNVLGDGETNLVDAKIEQIKSKPVLSLEEKMKELETKLEKIRMKMKSARNVISSVQVGVEMTDYSYLKLPMPLVAEQSSRYTGISFMMKTEESSGTIIYLGSRTSIDTLHLKLSEGRVQLKFDIGEGSTTLDTDVQVNDNQWHTVRISRNGKFGYISIDSGNDNITSFSGANGGSMDLLELESNSYFFVGCSRETANATSPEDMYKGSLTQLFISNRHVGLWGYLESGGNLAPTQAATILSQFNAAPRNGLCMKGWGYAMYPCNYVLVKPNQPLSVEIKLQTYDKNGMLFSLVNVNTTESVDLELVGGIARLTGPHASYTPVAGDVDDVVSVNKLTAILLNINNTAASISINGVKVAEYTLSAPLDWDELDCKRIYIGGDDSSSVSGLIKSVSLNGIIFSLEERDADVFTGMASSCLHGKYLDGLTSFGHGYARYPGSQFGQQFRVDLKLRTKQPYGVVFFGSDALGFNTISLSVDDGQVEFIAMRNYVKTSVRTGQDASDGNWHEVSVVREGDKITLNMDGYTSSTMLRDDVVYATTHGFWLTGIPADIPLLLDVVPQLLPYEGAIRSLAINGEVVDLQEFVEADDVTLAGTSIRRSIKTYKTIEREDQF